MSGWIKIHRKLQDSQMYISLNSKQRDVLLQCLLMANHSQNEWEFEGNIFKCKPGEFVTSLDSICKNCAKDVKVQSVRTALLKLEKWGFLTNKSTKTGRLITICKWDIYQVDEIEVNKDTNKGLTKLQQSSNKELTTNKNVKNDKEEYIYNKFYDLEIKKSNNDETYLRFVKILFGANDYKRPLDAVLSLHEQLSYKQFSTLLKLKEQFNISIKSILEDMEGWKDLKKNKTVLGTFRTFTKKSYAGKNK